MVDTIVWGAVIGLVALTGYRKLTTSSGAGLGLFSLTPSVKEEFEQGKSEARSEHDG